MKPVRLPPHTLDNLSDREISVEKVKRTLEEPDRVVVGLEGREIYMRVYQDATLGEKMLLRVVVEETDEALVVVTAYKTSKIAKYMKGD